jgi:peptidoglycan/LPS O-acetylase OafA/YrhL
MNQKDFAIREEREEGPDTFAGLQRIIRGRMPELDGLRGIAVLSVVWHNGVWGSHWGAHNALVSLLNLSAGIGWVGVQLFFVLSGFLITGILLDEKNTPHQLRNFYVRRVLRIFPLYYATLFFLFIALPALGVSPVLDIKTDAEQIWYWLFLSNWSIPIIGGPGALSHFWSLAVEEQFYLLWPFAVMLLSHRGLARLCLAFVVSALIVRIAMIEYNFEYAEWRAYEFTFARWDALAIGALLALALRQPTWHAWVRAAAFPLVVTALMYILTFVIVQHNYAAVERGIGAINQTVAALLFAALVYLGITSVTGRSAPWRQFLNNGVLRNVGKYSYAIYVFHYPLLVFFNLYVNPHLVSFNAACPTLATPARIIVVALISYCMAVCSWYLLERPFMRLRRFFVNEQARQHAPALQ